MALPDDRACGAGDRRDRGDRIFRLRRTSERGPTLERVKEIMGPGHTPLKRGVNERPGFLERTLGCAYYYCDSYCKRAGRGVHYSRLVVKGELLTCAGREGFGICW